MDANIPRPHCGMIPKQRIRAASRDMLGVLLGLLVYKAILDYVFVHYVAEHFAYLQFRLDISVEKIAFSYVVLLALALELGTLSSRQSPPSRIVLLGLLLILIIPILTIYGFQDGPTAKILLLAISFSMICEIVRFLPDIRVPSAARWVSMAGFGSLALVTGFVYYRLIESGGLDRFNVLLSDVYSVRSLFRETVAGSILGYFVPWQGNVINITLAAYAFRRRSIILGAIAVGLQILLFGMTNHRAYLLAIPLVAAILISGNKPKISLFLIISLISIVIFSYLSFVATGDHTVSSLFIRRLLFVPAENHLIYFDFFSRPGNPPLQLSNSILSGLFDYPYPRQAIEIIADQYYGLDLRPNVGFFGDAYAQFGLLGMVSFSFLLGLLLKLIDSVSHSLPPEFAAAIVTMPSFALLNSAFFTTLATHGFLLAIAVLFVSTRMTENNVGPQP